MKNLYEEALADVKRVREAAVKDAQQRVLEELTPRIRELIDGHLLGDIESSEDEEEEILLDFEDDAVAMPVQQVVEPMLTPVAEPLPAAQTTVPVLTPEEIPVVPPAPMAVTPALVAEPAVQDVLVIVDKPATQDDVCACEPAVQDERDVNDDLHNVSESLKRLTRSSKTLQESKLFKTQVSQLTSIVENIYDYVQETMVDSAQKTRLEERLESYYKQLNNLQEGKMSKKQLNEEDVTLKLTGLPSDLNLEDLGVDLIVGEEVPEEAGEAEESEEEEAELDLDLDASEEETEEVSAEEAPAKEEEEATELDLDLEVAALDDDTVVEIDENMLRKYIANIRESAAMTSDESATASVTTSLKEKETCEAETCEAVKEEEPVQEMENDDIVLTRECKIQRSAVKAGAHIRKSLNEARDAGDAKRVAQLTTAYKTQATRYSKSVERANKIKESLNEASTKVSSNSKPQTDGLRRKLSEANLDNVKLQYANMVLQTSVSNEKKLKVIEQLDAAKTIREAKLVYESAVKLLESANSVEKQKTLISGASRPTKSGGVVNEGVEVDRWARLAGLK